MAEHADLNILVVEPDDEIRSALVSGCLGLTPQVATATSYSDAQQQLSLKGFDICLMPVSLQDETGGSLHELCLSIHPDTRIILRCTTHTVMDAIQATREGVFAFFPWHGPRTEFTHLIEAAKRIRTKRANATWRARMVHKSRRIANLLDEIEHVSGSDKSVHITGPCGSGKRLAAELIHTASGRRDGAFVEVDCRAQVPELLSAQLFGQAAGLNSGMDDEEPGALQRVNGGVLLLHHIDAAPYSVQLQLVQAIEQRAVRPLGSENLIETDFRVITTSDRRLETQLDTGLYSEALYNQLHALEIVMPSLSERLEDIPVLAQSRAEYCCERMGIYFDGFDTEAMEYLAKTAWNGNVRQLFTIVDELVEHCDDFGRVSAEIVHAILEAQPRALATYTEAKAHFERQYLMQLMAVTDGNVAQAARFANRNRTDFYKLLHRNNLEPKTFKNRGESSISSQPTNARKAG